MSNANKEWWNSWTVACAREHYGVIKVAVWTASVLIYFIGDMALTIALSELGRLAPGTAMVEAHPVSAALLDAFGYPGLLIPKATVLIGLALIWKHFPAVGVPSNDPWRLIVPAIPLVRGVQLLFIHFRTARELLAACGV